MIETKEGNKKIQISENNLIEGQPILGYLISLIKEEGKKINEIHNDISQKLVENKKGDLTKEEKDKINKKFNKTFNINSEKNKNLFEIINAINKNHIKKYKTILNFLNLNLVLEKKEDVQENIQKELIKNKESQLENDEINYDQKISDKIMENGIIQKSENKEENIPSNNKIQVNEENLSKDKDILKNNLQNNVLIDKSTKIEGKINIKNKEIEGNESYEIIDYKENANYYKSNDELLSHENKNFFMENNDNELDLKEEENDIIINENDDSIFILDNDE